MCIFLLKNPHFNLFFRIGKYVLVHVRKNLIAVEGFLYKYCKYILKFYSRSKSRSHKERRRSRDRKSSRRDSSRDRFF